MTIAIVCENVTVYTPLLLWLHIQHGNKLPIQSKEELKPPDGMEWKSDWVVVREGAVGEGGWQFTSAGSGSAWMAAAQKQHKYQRRKWTRVSTRMAAHGSSKEVCMHACILKDGHCSDYVCF